MGDYEREFQWRHDLEVLGDAECPGCGHINDHGTGCAYADAPERESVSERLRLHYIGGAHVGLRGEWARLIRDETATLAEISRRYRRMRRDLDTMGEVTGTFTPHIDDEVIF